MQLSERTSSSDPVDWARILTVFAWLGIVTMVTCFLLILSHVVHDDSIFSVSAVGGMFVSIVTSVGALVGRLSKADPGRDAVFGAGMLVALVVILVLVGGVLLLGG